MKKKGNQYITHIIEGKELLVTPKAINRLWEVLPYASTFTIRDQYVKISMEGKLESNFDGKQREGILFEAKALEIDYLNAGYVEIDSQLSSKSGNYFKLSELGKKIKNTEVQLNTQSIAILN